MFHLLLTVALAAATPIQGGYTTEEFPEHGLSLPRPRDFVLAPLPMDEYWRVLYFAEKPSVVQRQGRSKPPICFVVRIDGDPQGARPASGTSEPIVDFDGYIAAFHTSYARSAARGEERERDGYVGNEYDLIPDKESSGASWCFVYERSQPTPRTFALIGNCGKQDLQALLPIWREMAGKMRFADPVAPDRSAAERLYAGKPFSALSTRVDLRMRLVRGWDAEDSEHFIALVHQPRKPYLKRVLADLEGLHAAFEDKFAWSTSADVVGVLRLCESRDEYLLYGGDPNFAALWNDSIGELILYDPVKDGDRAGEDAALASLRGQAFAQYAHEQVGKLAHPWFTRGYIDYYSGAQLSGRSLKVRPSSGLAYVQRRIEKGDVPPWSELLRAIGAEFDKLKGFYLSGSLVYFLRESKEAAAHERWSGLLDRYLSTLLATHAEQLEAGSASADARSAAREAALAAALEGVDANELGSTWARFTSALRGG
ncbi:MAG TPA: hypothetical protein VMT18_12635 [Planctomycetota bacterium]|nr:hypothetical protein [Planctomycetota bacterium]